MSAYHKLTAMAEAKIKALRDCGCAVTDADVIALNSLSVDINSHDRRMALAKGRPVRCGNVWLWPFTIHSKAWFADVGCNFKHAEYALAYALANRDKELYTTTQDDVLAWSKTLKCTEAELNEAVSQILDADSEYSVPVETKDAITIHELATSMAAAYGGNVLMWEREVSLQHIYDYLDTVSRQAKADGDDRTNGRALKAFTYLASRIRRRSTNGR